MQGDSAGSPNGERGQHNRLQAPINSAVSPEKAFNTEHSVQNDDENSTLKRKRTFIQSLRRNFWMVITCSWINVLLVFVPVGIAVRFIPGVHGGVIFAMNCVAIIPLAGLLAHATESVASEMGDALGALMNISFGNSVELIIFIIALEKNKIRIVQASLLGSILANLLLILGMGFFLGGMRYQEQLYNATVTQMSACLLSLSVISLVLPTAFHASFDDSRLADVQSLKISRGTSIILLLVYGLFLLFQLKSHAYMYESTPRALVDAEALPGPAAAWLDGNNSDDSSQFTSDSDGSEELPLNVRDRVKNILLGSRSRKASATSLVINDHDIRRSSFVNPSINADEQHVGYSGLQSSNSRTIHHMGSVETYADNTNDDHEIDSHRKKRRVRHGKHRGTKEKGCDDTNTVDPGVSQRSEMEYQLTYEPDTPRIDIALTHELASDKREHGETPSTPRAVFQGLRNLAPTIFAPNPNPGMFPDGSSSEQRPVTRRTNSLPARLSIDRHMRSPGGLFPTHIAIRSTIGEEDEDNKDNKDHEDHKKHSKVEHEQLSKKAAIILLLITTGLVALCAEFLISSIEDVTKSSTLSETFIGLIVLPIVGNAAEHITAITVAMKNKMDLAIGVAIGSSIQIALLITPLVVILGWCMDRELSLYFTLFETVCLFVSAFIVNFLVLDGRSNYMEGALLCAVYVIIAVVAFFYPEGKDVVHWGTGG